MKYIAVILHGYQQKPRQYFPLKQIIERCYPDSTVLIPSLALSTFSTADPDAIVFLVLKLINREWEKELERNTGHPEAIKIILIGHSTGSVLARKLYVVACGENRNAPFEPMYSNISFPVDWAPNVERLILFAGINRGWTVGPHLYNKTAILMRVGIIIGHIVSLFGRVPIAFKTRRGAPFITQLRIQWLSMLSSIPLKRIGDAMVIQLLGTHDDIISPDDNIDLVTGGRFIYLEVPCSDHMSVIKMNERRFGSERANVFENALRGSKDYLYQLQVVPADEVNVQPDNSVTDVVFVIHGIRDTGYWTQKVARRVKIEGDKAGKKFATETSTYGYFPMLSFLIPFFRSEKVEWLMDKYTENMARYPDADFSFMGHSNGTYLLSKALEKYPACHFKNVVFAGSVVKTNFDWSKMIRVGRIKRIFNFVASSDWVVAIFPKTFQALSIQDLGSGGFDGFQSVATPDQLKFIKGGHGAATEEKYWNEIAQFIVNGVPSSNIGNLATPQRSKLMKSLGALAPIPFLIIVFIIIGLGWFVFQLPNYVATHSLFKTPASFSFKHLTIQYSGLCLYILVIWKIITRF